MKVELYSVRINQRMSEETTCFSADLYIDGVKVGTATNDGHGGACVIHMADRELFLKLDEFCKAQPPVIPEDLGEGDKFPPLSMDMDFYITLLVEQHEEMQYLHRQSKKITFFRLKNERYKRGEWQTIKSPFTLEVKAALLATHGDNLAEIANERFSRLVTVTIPKPATKARRVRTPARLSSGKVKVRA